MLKIKFSDNSRSKSIAFYKIFKKEESDETTTTDDLVERSTESRCTDKKHLRNKLFEKGQQNKNYNKYSQYKMVRVNA